MTISRWKRSKDMMSLRDAMDRLIEDSFLLPRDWTAGWPGGRMIPLDMYEEGNNLIVKAPMPGMKAEDLNVEVHEDVLTISGEVKEDKERKEEDYHLRERHYGQIKRSVSLPYPVKVEQAQADFEDGILTLTLPKAESAKGKKIEVKVSGKR